MYILVALTVFTHLSNGFNLFAECGRTGEPLGGIISTVALLYLIGGLIAVPGLVGLVINKNWGKVIASIGMGLGFLGGMLTMTIGTIPLLQVTLPLVSIILLFISKK